MFVMGRINWIPRINLEVIEKKGAAKNENENGKDRKQTNIERSCSDILGRINPP